MLSKKVKAEISRHFTELIRYGRGFTVSDGVSEVYVVSDGGKILAHTWSEDRAYLLAERTEEIVYSEGYESESFKRIESQVYDDQYIESFLELLTYLNMHLNSEFEWWAERLEVINEADEAVKYWEWRMKSMYYDCEQPRRPDLCF